MFNVIKAKLWEQKNAIPGVTKFDLKTHVVGKSYFYFQFPCEVVYTFNQFILMSHHLSVNEGAITELDHLSESHYTADFKTSSNVRYRMHVYFDTKGLVIGKPLLAELNDQEEYISVSCKEYEAVFKNIAQYHAQSLLDYLIKEKQQLIDTLQNEYEIINQEVAALSVDVLANQSRMLPLINQQIQKIEELSLFHNLAFYSKSCRVLLGKKTLLNNLKKIVENVQKTSCSSAVSSSSSSNQEASNPNPPEKNKGKSPIIKKDTQKPKFCLESMLIDLNTQFELIEVSKDVKQIEQLERLYTEVRQHELSLDLNNYEVSILGLRRLQSLKDKIEQLALKLLQFSLISEDVDRVTLLKPFYHLLADNMFEFALVKDRIPLLKFLIDNKIIEIQCRDFKIQNTYYASILAYSFIHSKLDLVKFLLEKGISLMEIDAKTGLPYASNLLLNEKHPFHSLLKSELINAPLFYRKLNHVLRALKLRTGTSKEIEKLIELNDKKIALMNYADSFGYDRENSFVEEMKEKFKTDLIDRMLNDPEVTALASRIQHRNSELLAKKSVKEQIATKLRTKALVDKMKNSVRAVSGIEQLPDFEELKTEYVFYLLNMLRILDLQEELFDLNQLVNPNPVYGKISREHKKIARRQQEIFTEIKRLEAANPIHQQDADSTMVQILQRLKSSCDINQLNRIFTTLQGNAEQVLSLNALTEGNVTENQKMVALSIAHTFFANQSRFNLGEEDRKIVDGLGCPIQ